MSENINNKNQIDEVAINNVDLDALQNMIQSNLDSTDETNGTNIDEKTQVSLNDSSNETNTNEQPQSDFMSSLNALVDEYDITPQKKKFVISIEPKNIDFFEDLTPDERANLINDWLSEYKSSLKPKEKKAKQKEFITHIIITIATVLIAVPLIFKLINTSITSTVNSYKNVQINFERLYEQRGGVKVKRQKVKRNNNTK